MAYDQVTTISANKSKIKFDFGTLLKYKDLLYYMVLRDITVQYKQSILGVMWAVINPIIQTVIFTLIFGRLAGIPIEGKGDGTIFYFLGIIPWAYFSASLNQTSNSLIAGASIFTKVYFPRMIMPLTPLLSKLLDFIIGFGILIILLIWKHYIPNHDGILTPFPNVKVLLLPFFIILMIMTSLGLGLFLSSMALKYRDVKFAIQFILPLMMYLAPIGYSASLVLTKAGPLAYKLYACFPMVGVIEGFRACFIPTKPFPWDIIGISTLSSTIIFLLGYLYFKSTERYFADIA
jgi:lipopolysaccharide transport system permease protein